MAYDPANPFDVQFSGGNRSYNKADTKQTSFGQVFNPHYFNGSVNNPITGQWQPITTNEAGAIRVDIGTGIQINATVDDIAITGGQINVIGFSTLTGQVNTLIAAVATLTGSTQWSKTRTAGFASVYGAVTGSVLVNKVLGYSKTATVPGFIQLFDLAAAPTPGAIPDAMIAVQNTNNWFVDLAENGVRFNNGLQVVNSLTPDTYTSTAVADFTCTVIFKS